MNPSDIDDLNRNFSGDVTQRFLMAVDTIMGNRSTGKVTQKQIGDITGINSTNISRLRTDPERSVSLEACCRLCYFYKVSTFWLLLGEGQMWSNDELLSAYRILLNRLDQLEKAFGDISHSFDVIRKNIKSK